MVIRLYRTQRRRIERLERKERDAEMRQRYRIILCLHKKMTPTQIHRFIGAARSTVHRVRNRFLMLGERGLRNRRAEQPLRKVTEQYVQRLEEIIYNSPQDFGWQRTTWTCELLANQLGLETGIELHRTHVGRLLRGLGMRWGRPRPGPLRYTTRAAKRRKVNKIKRIIESLPVDEVAVYADEVDIHLNPKIGRDWMMPGQQKLVLTPGRNEKRYIAGALNHSTGELVWVEGKSKASGLFCALVKAVMERYRRKRRIHIVLDNYIIHSSKKTQRFLRQYGDRLVLHFLPPYCPNANRIERLWQDLHGEVTRNHDCRTMTKLMRRVRSFLNRVGCPHVKPARLRTYARAA